MGPILSPQDYYTIKGNGSIGPHKNITFSGKRKRVKQCKGCDIIGKGKGFDIMQSPIRRKIWMRQR